MDSDYERENQNLLTELYNSVKVRGRPDFPPVCPKCAMPANEKLEIGKRFVRAASRGKRRYDYIHYLVPFCGSCATKHRAEEKPAREEANRNRLRRALFAGTGATVIAAALAVFYTTVLDTDFGYTGETVTLLLTGLLLVFVLVALLYWFNSPEFTVFPPTQITESVHFSDDLSTGFEPQWREFKFTQMAYTRSFAELNQKRLWDPSSPAARRARQLPDMIAYTLLGLAIAYFVYDNVPPLKKIVDSTFTLIWGMFSQ